MPDTRKFFTTLMLSWLAEDLKVCQGGESFIETSVTSLMMPMPLCHNNSSETGGASETRIKKLTVKLFTIALLMLA